jgi:SAM-dependent methyltransferase
MGDAFYQVERWLYLKSKILDEPAYSKEIFGQLARHKFKRVLDCGCGAGDFTRVMIEKGVVFEELIGFDVNTQLLEMGQKNFEAHSNIKLQVHNLYDEEANKQLRDFDLVTGQALLEHTNMEKAIPILKSFSKPGGYLYFPHNYMSPTMFLPIFDNAVDRTVVQNFDRFSIENQIFCDEVCGDSSTGAKLYNMFKKYGFDVIHFTTTDWLLYPKGDGYTDEEKEVLYILLDFFYDANRNERLPVSRRIHPKLLEDWRITRFRQIEDNELVYICPQTSILVRNPG